MESLPIYDLKEWMSVLDSFQQDLLSQILVNRTEEEAIDIWLAAVGQDNTATFGGNGKEDLLKSFKLEFYKFISKDEEYKDERREFEGYVTVTKFFVVSFLSSTLSERLGVASSVIAPLIVLVLGLIGKMGIKAYHSRLEKEIKK